MSDHGNPSISDGAIDDSEAPPADTSGTVDMIRHRLPRGSAAIILAWNAATPETRAAGAAWYTLAASECRAMLPNDPERAAGIVAALSPRVSWARNLTAARAVCSGEEPRGVLRANAEKAHRIMAGEAPLAVLGGPKVRAFFLAITGDMSSIVVDVWAARVARVPEPDTERRYLRAAAAYRIAARRIGHPPAHVQAATWIHIRGSAV